MHHSHPESADRFILEISHDLEDIVPILLSNRKKDLQTLRDALVKQDFRTVATLGHRMKGDGGGLGFNRITEIGAYSIRHEVGIKASPKAVYLALTDTKKLAGWWTSDTSGDGSKVGGVLEFWFGDSCHKFEVVELQPGKLVRWKADRKEGLDEWAGTEVAFSLSADEKQCYVHFSHSGWRRDSGIFPHTSTKWAVFMLSLKDLLEKGKGHPAPDDVGINHD